MEILKTTLLFAITAVAEILGCYLAYGWAKEGKPAWWLIPSAGSLAAFAGLLTLHPTAAGRTYAAYGGMYIAVAIVWLWKVERMIPTWWDIAGSAIALLGMTIIMLGPRP